MWAWVAAFFTSHLWKILSVIADIIIVAIFIYALWNLFHPKPTTTQNQTANKIYNYTLYPDRLDFALGKIGGFEVFSYHSYPSTPATSQKVSNKAQGFVKQGVTNVVNKITH